MLERRFLTLLETNYARAFSLARLTRRLSPENSRMMEWWTNRSTAAMVAQMPATVVSLTFPDDNPDAVSVFFLRTPFTISEFRREIHLAWNAFGIGMR